MNKYQVQATAELERRKRIATVKPLQFFGKNLEFLTSTDHERMLSGPAETGKTMTCLFHLNDLMIRHPGSRAAIVRKIYNDLHASVVQSFEQKIHPYSASKPKPYGGSRPERYIYNNGSVIWLAGMDRPGKVLSAEFDVIYVNQAEELAVDDWETLTTRCTGRAGNIDKALMFGDCNPGAPSHWILSRRSSGTLSMTESRHRDNPMLYNQATGEITEQGIATMAVLDSLTGVRKYRLRDGLWVAAEGIVYEGFDRAIHIIPRFEIPASWRRMMSIDFGYTNPLSVNWWAIDHDGRLFKYREIYATRRMVEDVAKQARDLSAGENIERIICDHDAEDRATWERHFGQSTVAAKKAIAVGIQKVQKRLENAGDGKPRIYFLADSLVECDQRLADSHQPVCTEDEFELYSWPKDAGGRAIKEVPVDKDNHGMDNMRYTVMELDDDESVDVSSLLGIGHVEVKNKWA